MTMASALGGRSSQVNDSNVLLEEAAVAELFFTMHYED